MQTFGHFYLNQPVTSPACSQSSLAKTTWCLVLTISSSKQLPRTLKTEISDAHRAGEGQKKTEKHCQEARSQLLHQDTDPEHTSTMDDQEDQDEGSAMALTVPRAKHH